MFISPGRDAGLPLALSSSAPIYIPGWREALRVKCQAQEHNTMSTARARTRTARTGSERINHEATASFQVDPLLIVNRYF